MPEGQFTVIGPVLSGKTTYFAALFYLLKNAEAQYPFRLDPHYDIRDRVYLNVISQKWANLERIDRTVSDFWGRLEMPLLSTDGKTQMMVFIPDLGGEFFQQTLASRTWEEQFATNLSESSGIMLFINVTDYRYVVGLKGKPLNEPENAMKRVNQLVPWEPEIQKLPSDVTYTDLIQQVYFQNQSRTYRLSIVLSAWDSIKKGLTKKERDLYNHPEQYFRERFPLLSQFLDSHSTSFQGKVFGVSAYGCDPTEATEREKLDDIETFERVQVVGPEGFSHDITLPLMHLLNNE